VAYLGGGGLCEAPLGRTAVIFVTIFGIILVPFRDKIAATSDQKKKKKLLCIGKQTIQIVM